MGVQRHKAWCVQKVLREHLSITSSHTYVHKELAPARIKEHLKAVGKLVDLSQECIYQSMERRHSDLREEVSKCGCAAL